MKSFINANSTRNALQVLALCFSVLVGTHSAQAKNFVVTNTGDDGKDGCTVANVGDGCTLLEEVVAASLDGEDSAISFDGPVFANIQTIALTGTELFLAKDGALSITAPARGVIISGNNLSRVFNIETGANVTLTRLLMVEGKNKFGGAIRNSGTLTLNTSAISRSSTGDNGTGGGIRNDGNMTLNNSMVAANSVGTKGQGGGIYNGGGKMILNNSIVTANTAGTDSVGAGIRSFGILEVNNSTITKNVAGTGSIGGGIVNNGKVNNHSLVLISSIVAGNTSAQEPNVMGHREGENYLIEGDPQLNDLSYGENGWWQILPKRDSPAAKAGMGAR